MTLVQRLASSAMVATFSVVAGFTQPSSALAREVRVYSGRHYNTDRQVFKKFSQETGIRVRLIEATRLTILALLPLIVRKLKFNSLNLFDELVIIISTEYSSRGYF